MTIASIQALESAAVGGLCFAELATVAGRTLTILIVVLTGVVGASLARYQGFLIINKIRSDVSSGRVPARELIDGLLVLIGGIVLLTPGFLTDIFGFVLLIPITRNVIKGFVRNQFERMANYRTTITIE